MDFEQLSPQIINKYYDFVQKFASFSDLNYTSLLSWSENTKVCLENGILIVIFDDYSSDSKIITGISEKADEILELLLELQAGTSNSTIDALPAAIFESARKNPELVKKFEKSRDQSDYLYKPQNQIDLEGHQYVWHRRKLAAFNRGDYGQSAHSSLEIDTDDIDAFQNAWQKWKDVSNKKEIDALNRYIGSYDELINQVVIKITIKDKIVAFAFCELVEGKTKDLVIHFFKSDQKYDGLSNFLFYSIADYSMKLGVDYINFEQDLGEKGLRYYKEHLRPDKMLDKFELIREDA
jgi:hypothetical protein